MFDATSDKSGYRMTLALLIFCAISVPARADSVPLYTGSFVTVDSFNFWGPGAGAGVQGAMNDGGLDGNLGYEFDFGAPIANFQETAWCGYGCPQYVTGEINSGTVWFSGYDRSGTNLPYAFTGYILPGGTFSAEIVCSPDICNWGETLDLLFQSQSNENGWQSTGELNISGSNDGTGGNDHGILTLNTYAATTPEPGTFLLFGSGIVGLGGIIRRKIGR